MIAYVVRRLLYFLPTLLLISIIAFSLSLTAPGDPVEMRNSTGASQATADPAQAARLYRETAVLMGLDKPDFYVSWHALAMPDTLYRILRRDHRENLRLFIRKYGNWPQIQAYYHAIQALDTTLYQAGPAINYVISRPLRELYLLHDDRAIRARLDSMSAIAARDSLIGATLGIPLVRISEAYHQLLQRQNRLGLYIPTLSWHGIDNRYHVWLLSMLRGDFGVSLLDGRPVGNKLWDALRWTLLLNLIVLVLSFGLAVPLGVWTAQYAGTRKDELTTLALFLLYSLPVFWVATLLQVFFTTPEYGMNWFPVGGLSELPASASWYARVADQAAHLLLPVICLTYGSLAFISRQMRGGMLQVLGQDYIRTARAKGLTEGVVIWKHAFRNALFPIITLIGAVLPSVLAGSVLIEVIFSLPGMGKLAVDAIFARDWPVVFAVLMLSSLLTIGGTLLADILYVWADPRVSFSKKVKR